MSRSPCSHSGAAESMHTQRLLACSLLADHLSLFTGPTQHASQGSMAPPAVVPLGCIHCVNCQACLHDDAFEGALQRAAHNGSCLAPHALETLDNQSPWPLLVLCALKATASVPAQRQLRLAADSRSGTCRQCTGRSAGAGAAMRHIPPMSQGGGQVLCMQPCARLGSRYLRKHPLASTAAYHAASDPG